MSKLLINFISNIFDIYPSDSFLKSFISDNNLNINAVISNELLNHNLCFNFLWHTLYKNYPTKRDFQNYMNFNKYLPSTTIEYDNKFIEKVLNSFFLLKIGLLNYVNTQEISKQFDSFYKELNLPIFKINCIYEKWKHRYNLNDEQLNQLKSANLFITFSNIFKAYKDPNIIKTLDYNVISNNYNDTISLVDQDILYLNEYEKMQYILFKDNHFLMKLLGNTCIMIDGDISSIDLNIIINNYIKIEDKHIVLLNANGKYKWDSTFMFEVPCNLYNIIPRICKSFILISNKKYPEYSSLSIKRENSIYYLLNNHINNIENPLITNTFDRYIISDIRQNSIVTKINKYLILNPVEIKEYNKNSQIRIKCGEETLKSIKLNDDFLINKTDTYDFIIDYNNELDILPYMLNGAIPIIKEKNIYVKNLITGFYINDVNKSNDFINQLISIHDAVLNKIRTNMKLFEILVSKNMNDLYWKSHIQGGCPMRSIGPKNGILLYLNFIILYFCKKIEEISTIPKYNSESLYKVILIDNRSNPLSIISLLFTMTNLNENWSPIIYTSKSSMNYYNREICEVRHLDKLDISKFHIDIYNNILKDTSLWESIKADKCLMIQEDGILLRKGIEKFEEYDYIGASWADCVANEYIKNNISNDLVGNGGFSLRTVPKMIEICKNFEKEKTWLFYKNMTQIPEDVYFVNGLKKINANMPKYDVGTAFASEEICNYQSLGLHKMWSYHMGEIVQTYFNKILSE